METGVVIDHGTRNNARVVIEARLGTPRSGNKGLVSQYRTQYPFDKNPHTPSVTTSSFAGLLPIIDLIHLAAAVLQRCRRTVAPVATSRISTTTTAVRILALLARTDTATMRRRRQLPVPAMTIGHVAAVGVLLLLSMVVLVVPAAAVRLLLLLRMVLVLVAVVAAAAVVLIVRTVLPFGEVGLAVPIKRWRRSIGLIIVLQNKTAALSSWD